MRISNNIYYPVIFLVIILIFSSCRDDTDESTADDASQLISKMLVNSTVCSFDAASGSFFYAVSPGESQDVIISIENRNVIGFTVEGKSYRNGTLVNLTSFETGNKFEIIPQNVSGKSGQPVRLILTSLPLVNIRVKGQISDNPKIECYISLADPGGKTNGSQRYFPEHRAGIEIRGGLSQSYPKKSYSLEFWKSGSNEESDDSTRLFGFRDDGDWILDAMYIDYARMRNRLSTDIWISMNKVPYADKEPGAVNGTRGCFVELFLNDSYQGLYCMTEKVDRKQLNLNTLEGFSYKAYAWSNATEFIHGNTAFNNTLETWDGWQIEFQGENSLKAVPPLRWELLRNFIQFTVNSADADFASSIASKINIDNLVDYLLFTNAIGADDNTGKNTFFSFYNNSDKRFFITPWDMDGSWGRKWNGSKIDLREGEFIGVTGIPRSDSRYCRPNAFFQRMMTTGSAEFRLKLKSRWKELRNGVFSVNKLSDRINAYQNLFLASGAYEREKVRWPAKTTDLKPETDFMLSWIQNRLVQVDNYVNGL